MKSLIPAVVLVPIIAGLGAVKYRQYLVKTAAAEAMQRSGPPPEVVATALARADTWERTVRAVGTVAAVQGVPVSAEVPGVVTAIRFESGARVRAGQVLVELDTRVERAQLESALARRDLAQLAAGRTRRLAASQSAPQAQLDADESQLRTSGAEVLALRAQIARKTIRAPFAGRLGIRSVALGQYVNPGTAVTLLESQGAVYVDFALPQQDLAAAPVGTAVRVRVAGASAGAAGEELAGTVSAVDATVDAATRTIRLRASVPDEHDRLRPGMFVEVTVVRAERDRVVIAPATAVVHAPYGDSVFVVETPPQQPRGAGGAPPARTARQQFVRLGASRGDFVAIVDGVTAGQELVTAGAFKLRNGSTVEVHNDAAPTPSLRPSVENR